MERVGEHLVVMGGSMAGLAVAAALADRFARVTVVERDPLPRMGTHRKGVPQGRHGHALLAAGMIGLCEILPSLTDDLRTAGGEILGRAPDLRIHINGGMLCPVDRDFDTVAASRSLIEGVVRERVRELDTVRILDSQDHVLCAHPRCWSRDQQGQRCDEATALRGCSSALGDLLVFAQWLVSSYPSLMFASVDPAPFQLLCHPSSSLPDSNPRVM
jgi:hypothetical protein